MGVVGSEGISERQRKWSSSSSQKPRNNFAQETTKGLLRLLLGLGRQMPLLQDKTILGGGVKGCYFCFMQPQSVESPVGSQTSDPQ
ncbi:hypothetical protein O6P43_010961 [Quillaja saponaria]|uniref:Uncharacterized protein n=1 Tax=Quillaja saponaria TaxID=32244 RepID=A0AAD7Q1L0_QUISA|nr:hypothetical protein O6P43_010961 [Quillaja saponaria]